MNTRVLRVVRLIQCLTLLHVTFDYTKKFSISVIYRSIERDMKTVSSALEYAYKVNKEANAQALQHQSTATPPPSSSSNTSANQ